MKKIICLCFILPCLINFCFAQSNTKRMNMKKPVVNKTEDTKISEAEKTWKLFFAKFKEAIKSQDVDFMKEIIPKNFDCWGWNSCTRNNNSNPETIELFLQEMKDSSNGWSFLYKIIKEGKISSDAPNTKSISSKYLMYVHFEFRKGKWWFIGYRHGEGA